MNNLWEETIHCLDRAGKAWSDIRAIRVSGKRMDKDVFEKHAKTIDYDPGYGLNAIELSLRLFGDDFIMVRREYDGAEWWEVLDTNPIETDEYADTRDALVERYHRETAQIVGKTLINKLEGADSCENQD